MNWPVALYAIALVLVIISLLDSFPQSGRFVQVAVALIAIGLLWSHVG